MFRKHSSPAIYLAISVFPLLVLPVSSCGSHQKSKNEMKTTNMESLQIATLGGGCFWCIEAIFRDVKGVEKVTSGYSGGQISNPTYREVTSGLTGHAEVVQIAFDPKIISYSDLLIVFFHLHDPTTLNRQGADVGTHYRSVIFYHSEEQERTAREVIQEIEKSKLWNNSVVTEIAAFTKFYIAEDYHQDYYANNKNAPYCNFVISPKIQKLKKQFGHLLKDH